MFGLNSMLKDMNRLNQRLHSLENHFDHEFFDPWYQSPNQYALTNNAAEEEEKDDNGEVIPKKSSSTALSNWTSSWPTPQISVDVVENDKEYTLEANLPGFSKDEIKVNYDDNQLTISAEHKEEKNVDEKNYKRRERKYGSVKRTLTLPAGVDHSKIVAKNENGVLHLTIPKKEEKENAGNIPIH